MSDVMNAALAYAARGWRVVPLYTIGADGLCDCKEGGCGKSAAKHPRVTDWQNDASTDPATIRRWWGKCPEANVGVLTGALENGRFLVALDIDPKSGGNDSFDDLVREFGALPSTMEVHTGSGGRHFYFEHTAPLPKRIGVRPGIDIIAGGEKGRGQLVAPPSVHQSGRTYAWELSSPDEACPPPAWLVALAIEGKPRAKRPASASASARAKRPASVSVSAGKRAPASTARYVNAALERACESIRSAPEGTRNDTLNREVYSVSGLVGLDREHAQRELEAAAHDAGLQPDEIAKTLSSAMTAGALAPREVPARVSYAIELPPLETARECLVRLASNPADAHSPDAIAAVVAVRRERDRAAKALKAAKVVGGPDGERYAELYALLDSVRDAIRRQNGEPAVAAWEYAVAVAMYLGNDPRALVRLTTDEHITADCIRDALAKDAEVVGLYQRACKLVQVVAVENAHGRPGVARAPEAPTIAEVSRAHLRDMTSRACLFYTSKVDPKTGEVVISHARPDHPPVQTVHESKRWERIPSLRGIAAVPPLRPDGSVAPTAGYDEATGIFYAPAGDVPPGPEQPTEADAHDALEMLYALLADFPFEAEHHRSTVIGAVLTVVARPAFSGPTPLFLFDATAPGSGKGLLANVVSIIGTGRSPAVMGWPADDDEARKRIFAVLLSGDPVLCFDNITSKIGGSALEMLLTSTMYSDRLLGKSETPTVENLTTTLATGNNVQMTGDMTRRVALARLAPSMERPEDRPLDGYRIPDLLGFVHAHRGELVCAALTILRAYILAGRPAVKVQPWGSHTAWEELVARSLAWAGAVDLGLGRAELRENADPEAENRAGLLRGWEEAQRMRGRDDAGLTVPEVVNMLAEDERLPLDARKLETLRMALAALCPVTVTPRTIGNSLKKFRGRVIGGLTLGEAGKDRTGCVRWRAVHAESAGSAESVFSPTRARSVAGEGERTPYLGGPEGDSAESADSAPPPAAPPGEPTDPRSDALSGLVEAVEERAAIGEYDGGLTRASAEAQAWLPVLTPALATVAPPVVAAARPAPWERKPAA